MNDYDDEECRLAVVDEIVDDGDVVFI